MYLGMVDLESDLVGSMLVRNTSNVPVNSDELPTYRVYGPNGFVEDGTCAFRDTDSVSNASNEAPIIITSAAHGLTTGARVTITGVLGNTAANGTFTVTRIDANTYSLDSSSGNGAYTSGGTWNVTGWYGFTISATGTNGYEKSENYQVLFVYEISTVPTGQPESFQVS